ncbi:MAG: hypothetical protein ACR2NB_07080 [Solirubrobacteraceae bacterium]
MPRTTLDLDASVLRELRRRGERQRKSMGQVASELLTGALAGTAQSRDRSLSSGPLPIWGRRWSTSRTKRRCARPSTGVREHDRRRHGFWDIYRAGLARACAATPSPTRTSLRLCGSTACRRSIFAIATFAASTESESKTHSLELEDE